MRDKNQNIASVGKKHNCRKLPQNGAAFGGFKTFDPEVNVTREELATMIYLYQSIAETPVDGADLSGFSDASSISPWAKEGLAWANAAGIVGGTSETTISPAESATRAQVSTVLCRYLDYME